MGISYRYHYTPYSGWINDPNGLIYADGIYHMYFQHNPDAPVWGSIGWGHAVSDDLVNWKNCGEVLRPDSFGMIYSGSAVAAGSDIWYFYTAADNSTDSRHYTQRTAVSHDGGYTLTKTGKCAADTICGENRDPKVIWHGQSGAYVMILWLEDNDFAILRSEDISGSFRMTQRITLPHGFECPNLFQIGDNWFIWTAGGYYYPGSFDGYEFRWSGIVHRAYADDIPYAAQVYSGTGEDVIMIPWLRIPAAEPSWCGVMGIPRKLGCVSENGDIKITQRAVFTDENEITDGNITETMTEGGTVLKVAVE